MAKGRSWGRLARRPPTLHRKEGRRAVGHTPVQLLAEAVDICEESAMVRWWEWEQASEGRRQLAWSTGHRDLRKLAGPGAEATDEDIAAEELHADARFGLNADAWDCVERAQLGLELLAVAEDGLDGARAWLTPAISTGSKTRSGRTGIGRSSQGAGVLRVAGKLCSQRGWRPRR
jgi:hypothetical protein